MEMPTKRRWLAAAAAATLLSGLATACSSSSSTTAAAGANAANSPTTSSSPATSSSSTASSSGSAQGKTITLGILTPLTGPVASSFGQATIQGAQARIDLANADHELPNGEQIKLVSADEGSSPQTSLSGTQQLVENDHVFGVLAAGAFFYGAYRWAAQQNVPVVGDGIDGPEWNSNQYPNMFAAFGSTDDSYPSYTGMPAFFKAQGGTSYCGVGYNAPSTVGNGAAMAGSMKAAGVPVPYTNFGIVAGNSNFTSIALAVKQAKCNVLGSQMTLGDTLTLISALHDANVSLKATFIQGGYGQDLLDQPSSLSSAQGVDMAAGYEPSSLNTTATKAMMSALKTYAGWTKPYPAAGMEWGWFTADTAIEGLKVAGANPTQQSFITNLRKVASFDHEGLTCPVNYSVFSNTNQQFPGNCTWMVKVKGDQFVSLTGTAPVKVVTIPGTSNG
jgi:branched-chain amino acid transport system substrate-binding protein